MTVYEYLLSTVFEIGKFALYAAAGLTTAAVSGLYFFQHKMLYVNTLPDGAREPFSIPKDDIAKRHIHSCHFRSPESIHGWLFLHDTHSLGPHHVIYHQETCPEKPISFSRPTILFLHGNAGNILHRYVNMLLLFNTGCNVFIFDYRGYGMSSGNPDEPGLIQDSIAALDYLRNFNNLKPSLIPTDSIDPSKIIVFGRSLGGAVALGLAEKRYSQIHSLILENTFTSIPDMVPHILSLIIPPLQSHYNLINSSFIKNFCRLRWFSKTRISKLVGHLPILMLSGREDEIVPRHHMDQLYATLTKKYSTPKAININPNVRVLQAKYSACTTSTDNNKTTIAWFCQVPNGKHNETWVLPGYREVLRSFYRASGLDILE